VKQWQTKIALPTELAFGFQCFSFKKYRNNQSEVTFKYYHSYGVENMTYIQHTEHFTQNTEKQSGIMSSPPVYSK